MYDYTRAQFSAITVPSVALKLRSVFLSVDWHFSCSLEKCESKMVSKIPLTY